MATTRSAQPGDEAAAVESLEQTAGERLRAWFFEDAAWWLSSFLFHLLLMTVVAFINVDASRPSLSEAPSFTASDALEELPPEEVTRIQIDKIPIDPGALTTDTLLVQSTTPVVDSVEAPADVGVGLEGGAGWGVTGVDGIESSAGVSVGGLDRFDVRALGPGPAVRGTGSSFFPGAKDGPNGPGGGGGFDNRRVGKKTVGAISGMTNRSERSVAAALNWLARHQLRDGSWSLEDYKTVCKDATCSGTTSHGKHDGGATAMALLPFLAAGQTHESKGPYQRTIYNGLGWLLSQQKPDGDLRCGGNMYSHGLAAIALCEAYGMTGDKRIGGAAQKALDFIIVAQHPQTGGWRYNPGDEGDTSVMGWQLMALKSGHLAGLTVPSKAFDGAKHWLALVSTGNSSTAGFAYVPKGGATPTMTSVGLLSHQYLGAKRNDHLMTLGGQYLLANAPDRGRNVYYWYYATQVMHNLGGPDWDQWNRQMRRTLIESQERDGCATGSWNPTGDAWGSAGGRVMQTSFSALTLEVYYRYLPLYKLDEADANSVLAEPTEKVNPAPQRQP